MNDGAALNINERFEVIYCYKCRMPFAVPGSVRQDWLSSGQSFFCPNGHDQHYTQSEVSKLKKELENERKRKEWAEQAAKNAREERDAAMYRERAQKAAKTRLKNRVAKGVCPCCNRTFENLARHMSAKHPDFAHAE